jgi:hypothetical protein
VLRIIRSFSYGLKDPRSGAYDDVWGDVYPDDGPGHDARLAELKAQLLGLEDALVVEHWQAAGQELVRLTDQAVSFGQSARLTTDCRRQLALAHLLSVEAAKRGLELLPAAA